MEQFIPSLLTSLCAFILSLTGCYTLIPWLTSKQYMDIPQERSNHTGHTPTGGGLALVTSILVSFLIYCLLSQAISLQTFGLIAISACLMTLSWLDDKHSLPALLRLAVHLLLCSLAVLFLFDFSPPAFMPPALFNIALILAWVWYMNLYNFMDGIDGITSIQTLCVCAGIIILGLLHNHDALTHITLAAIIAAATCGFLCFNWHPAKLFMGDVGSIPLGFLTGYLLLQSAYDILWAAPLILTFYYLTDASYTLLKRLKNKEKIWIAHSKHFYQQAVRGGKSHKQVVLGLLCTNLCLIMIALTTSYAVNYAAEGMGLASIIVYGFILYLTSHKRDNVDTNTAK